ncbi:transport protein particle component, Bet3, partial [Ancylostoma caninum]
MWGTVAPLVGEVGLLFRLASYGKIVGIRLLDVVTLREKGYRRETKLLGMLMFIKSSVWKNLFGKEADKLERSNDDQCTYLLIEKEPVVNTFISVPKDKGMLNCAAFVAGIIQAMLEASNFPCQVSAHWWNIGTAYVIRFDEVVISREAALVDTTHLQRWFARMKWRGVVEQSFRASKRACSYKAQHIVTVPEHLHRHLFQSDVPSTSAATPFHIELPTLKSRSLQEHFRITAEELTQKYKEFLERAALFPFQFTKPSEWILETGWTRYAHNDVTEKVGSHMS